MKILKQNVQYTVKRIVGRDQYFMSIYLNT